MAREEFLRKIFKRKAEFVHRKLSLLKVAPATLLTFQVIYLLQTKPQLKSEKLSKALFREIKMLLKKGKSNGQIARNFHNPLKLNV